MKVFEANIPSKVSAYFKDNLKNIKSCNEFNEIIYSTFGIVNFFGNIEEIEELKEKLEVSYSLIAEPDRFEYGDFQTNIDLANKVANNLSAQNVSPEVIIEPTCGKGNFIIAALKNFTNIKTIFGIEIYKPYIWETKFNIIEFYLNSPNEIKPDINIIHCNVFDYNFKQIANQFPNSNILIIGNPPWITNSALGVLNSDNSPRKVNFKNHSGLDAMTGKGNFDIAEFITMNLIEIFQNMNGHLLLLVKNSVIKNILFEQNKNHFRISSLEKHCIDSKKEFNVSVEAALFYCKFNSNPSYICSEFNFYENTKAVVKFGWVADKFVSNLELYQNSKALDGICPFEWRQGLKHDCSAIMELEKINDKFTNGENETVELEEDLVYGLLKSSDLKNTVISGTRKFTIVTQKKVGEETSYIKSKYPKTYNYLLQNKTSFDTRKSSIYKNKPPFSIFGIGDYSFKPYKVAISGLYKSFHFTLVLPQDGKPVMLDDTCYMIGFDTLEFAVYSLILLNSKISEQLLKCITFADAKRTFTKDVLMRLDLLELANSITQIELQKELDFLNQKYEFNLSLSLWYEFIEQMTPELSLQDELFA